jgi:hypothetical protein
MLKTTIKRIINLIGYDIVNKSIERPLDMRDICNSPFTISYYSYNQPILIWSTPENSRGRPLFNLSKNGVHPFIIAANRYLAEGTLNSIYKVLEEYYYLVQPKTASDLLSFSLRNNSPLNKIPAWSIVMPWDHEKPEDQIKNVENAVKNENKRVGVSAGIQDGWAWAGPANHKKINIESIRLKNIIDSVKAYGYQRHDGRGGDIPVYVFVNNQHEWCWQPKTGQHRTIAVSALGYKRLTIRILKVVRRDDVECWPNVINEIYTVEEALNAFDQVFTGEIPAIARKWTEICENYKTTD